MRLFIEVIAVACGPAISTGISRSQVFVGPFYSEKERSDWRDLWQGGLSESRINENRVKFISHNSLPNGIKELDPLDFLGVLVMESGDVRLWCKDRPEPSSQ